MVRPTYGLKRRVRADGYIDVYAPTHNRVENLEPVPHVDHPRLHELAGAAAANALKTHCLKGHPLVESNVYRSSSGGRACRICALDRARAQRTGARS